MKALVGVRIRVCRRSVFMNLKMMVMKCLLHSTLLGMLSIGVSAAAIAAPGAGPKPRTAPKPAPAIRPAPKKRDIVQDRHDVAQDKRDVTKDQRDLTKDRTDLTKDRHDVSSD